MSGDTRSSGYQQARALLQQGSQHALYHEHDDARRSFREAIAAFDQAGSKAGQALALCTLAQLETRYGNAAEARSTYEQAKQIYRGANNAFGEAYVTRGL